MINGIAFGSRVEEVELDQTKHLRSLPVFEMFFCIHEACVGSFQCGMVSPKIGHDFMSAMIESG